MSVARTYYDILGVPREATEAQIKRRYRQLVRIYHPDVAKDKAQAAKVFIQITEAYDALSDPARRRAYDSNLELEMSKSAARESAASRNDYADPRDEMVARLLSEAQFAFVNKRLSDALSACKQAVAMNPRCAKAHAMLGDIYRALGKPVDAAKYYTYAIQHDSNDRESRKKLMDMVGKQASTARRAKPQPGKAPAAYERHPVPRARIAVNMMLVTVAAFALFAITLSPGKPIKLLVDFVPPAAMWSLNLALLIAAASFIVGFVLSINGLVSNPDEELIFEGGENWFAVPKGLLLLLGSGLFFPAASAFYLIAGLVEGSLSKSIVTVFACVAVVVFIAALMYHEAAMKQVLLFGGNVSFIPMLMGWYLGNALRPLNE